MRVERPAGGDLADDLQFRRRASRRLRARRSRPSPTCRRAAACAAPSRPARARGRRPHPARPVPRPGAAAPSSTAFSASATGISAMHLAFTPSALKCPDLPPCLLDQADALDADAAIGGLHHVVDRQAADRDGGQRLHLDAGWAGDLDRRAHAAARQLACRFRCRPRPSTAAADGRAGSVRASAWPP